VSGGSVSAEQNAPRPEGAAAGSYRERAADAAAAVYPWLLAGAEFPPGSARRLGFLLELPLKGKTAVLSASGLQEWDALCSAYIASGDSSWTGILRDWQALCGPCAAPWGGWPSCAVWGRLLAARYSPPRSLWPGSPAAPKPLVAPDQAARQLASWLLSCAEDPVYLREAFEKLCSVLAGRTLGQPQAGRLFMSRMASQIKWVERQTSYSLRIAAKEFRLAGCYLLATAFWARCDALYWDVLHLVAQCCLETTRTEDHPALQQFLTQQAMASAQAGKGARAGLPEPDPLLAIWSKDYQLTRVKPASAAALRCCYRQVYYNQLPKELLDAVLGKADELAAKYLQELTARLP